MERFNLYTLVDITETGARRGEDPKLTRQQQNFHTVLQTIGLRVNLTYIGSPTLLTKIPKEIKFGSDYKNVSKVWNYQFDVEYAGALSVNALENDFNMIPVIANLDESIDLKVAAFDTKNPAKKNIIFVQDDK